MLAVGFVLISLSAMSYGAVWNTTCPAISPMKLDLRELDGKWYFIAAAADFQFHSECVNIQFKHTSINTTNLLISWVHNRTANYFNGSAVINDVNNSTGETMTVSYEDGTMETYLFLGIDYEHYAVVYVCNDNDDGNSSSYKLWQLSRKPHPKAEDTAKINEAIAKHSLQDIELVTFNNTEECCKTNSGGLHPASLIMTSAAAFTLLKRFY